MTDKSEPIIDGNVVTYDNTNVVTYDPTIYIIPKLRELSKQGVGIGEKCKQGLGLFNFTPENCMGDWDPDKDLCGNMIRRKDYSSIDDNKSIDLQNKEPNSFISGVNFAVKNPDLTIAKTSNEYKQNWKTLVKTLTEIVVDSSVVKNEESCFKNKNKIFIATHQGVLLKKFFSLNNENGKIKFANCSCVRITKDNSGAKIDIELIHPQPTDTPPMCSSGGGGVLSAAARTVASAIGISKSSPKCTLPDKKPPKKQLYLYGTCTNRNNLKTNLKQGSYPTNDDDDKTVSEFLDSNDIYFIRHGDAIHNAVKKFKKKSPKFSLSTVFNNVNSPLTPLGRGQAEKLFNDVFRHEIKTISISISGENMSEGVNNIILVSSPLDRAIETLMLSTTPEDMYRGAKKKFKSIFDARVKLLEKLVSKLGKNWMMDGTEDSLFPKDKPSNTGGKHNKTKRHAKRYKKRSISKKRQMKRKTAHSTRKLKKHRRVKQITRKR